MIPMTPFIKPIIPSPFKKALDVYSKIFEAHEEFLDGRPKQKTTIVEKIPFTVEGEKRVKYVPLHFIGRDLDNERWERCIEELKLTDDQKAYAVGYAFTRVSKLTENDKNSSGNILIESPTTRKVDINLKRSNNCTIIESTGPIDLTVCDDTVTYKCGKITGYKSPLLALYSVHDFTAKNSQETLAYSSSNCTARKTFKPTFIGTTGAEIRGGQLVILDKCEGTIADECKNVRIESDVEQIYRRRGASRWFSWLRRPEHIIKGKSIAGAKEISNSNGHKLAKKSAPEIPGKKPLPQRKPAQQPLRGAIPVPQNGDFEVSLDNNSSEFNIPPLPKS